MHQETIFNTFYLIAIPILPLLGAMFNGFFGYRIQHRFGKFFVHFPAIIMVFISFVLSFVGFIKLASDSSVVALTAHGWQWMNIGILEVNLAFIMDRLSAVMCLTITFVGTLIHIYSTGYMKDDPGYWRFFAYLNLFMSSMLILVLADNFLVMFIGWEGVGLCSYLLIGFWYKDVNNAKAGIKAFIVNRIGDFGFVIGIFILFWTLAAIPGDQVSLIFHDLESSFHNQALREAFLSQAIFNIPAINLICIALFVGAMGKSAQIPLYVWLPDAMAGPTPVSALIHAATMVTAGVYMVARLHFLFALSQVAMTWVALFGAVTALFAATIGFFQYDIKKVLAYSTISQLGFMFIGVGVGAYSAGIFHLVTHAFFKGCLFLCAGSVIMGCHHEQDMRKMGGLRLYMPKTNLAYLIACVAIAGFPFFSGFFSKDEILYLAFINQNMVLPGLGKLIWVIGMIAALCTSYYMFRSYFMTFTGTYSGDASKIPVEQPKNITYVLLTLAFFSAVAGFIGLPEIFHAPNLFHSFLEPIFESSKDLLHFSHASHGLEWLLMGFSVMIAFLGAALAFHLYKDAKNPLPAKLLQSDQKLMRWAHRFVYNKYYIDEFYQLIFIKPVMGLQRLLNWVDARIIDALINLIGRAGKTVGFAAGAVDNKGVDGAVNATANTVFFTGIKILKLQSGRLRHYLGAALAGGIILVIVNYVFFSSG